MKNKIPSKGTGGFTLIEMLVTVAIVSVLIGISVPNIIDWLPRYRLKNATRDLVSFMQKTKMAAVKGNKTLKIVFDSSSTPGFYYLDTDEDGNWDYGEDLVKLSEYKSGIDYGSGSTSTDWNNDTITKDITFSTGSASFTGRGTSNNGSVYFENKNSDICFSITVISTGTIKIREWTGTTWKD